MDKSAHYSKMLDSAHFILVDNELTSLKYMFYDWEKHRTRTLYSVDLEINGRTSFNRLENGEDGVEEDFRFETLKADFSGILFDQMSKDSNLVKN